MCWPFGGPCPDKIEINIKNVIEVPPGTVEELYRLGAVLRKKSADLKAATAVFNLKQGAK